MRRRNSCLAALELLRKAHASIQLNEVVAYLYIAENEGINVSELAQLAGFGSSLASRTARRLAAAGASHALAPALGLVELSVQGNDARGRVLTLSPDGRRLRDQLDNIIACGNPIAVQK